MFVSRCAAEERDEEVKLASPAGNLSSGFTDDAVIAAPSAEVFDSLRAVQAWPKFLPHVLEVSLTYQDSEHQAFTLRFDAGAGGTVNIRTVQRCDADSIAFFHPEPIGFLKHHCGTWFIRALGCCTTRLTLTQRWTPAYGAASHIAERLQCQARITLTGFKSALERPRPGRLRLNA